MSDGKLASNIELLKTFEQDLKDPRFDKIIFLTYTFEKEKILPLIPKNKSTIIYYYPKINGVIREKHANMELTTYDNHAKIYCMWGNESIKCWIGSFNLTESGLCSRIEWAACFEGKLQKQFSLADLGKTPSWEISDNTIVNQLIDLVSSIRNRSVTVLPDKLFNAVTTEPVIIHNLSSNTLIKSIGKLTTNAKSNIVITYVSPFVSVEGIETFAKLLPKRIASNKVVFHVITRMPGQGDSWFPGSTDIKRFQTKFQDFKLFKRKSSDNGIRLLDGTEISDNPIHLKFIHIAFVNKKNEREVHSIFTSANLSKEAWLENPRGKLEIGIWLKDSTDNEKISSFLENFRFCFSEPDKQELAEIDRILAETARENKIDELWFEELFNSNLTFFADRLSIQWGDGLPDIENVEATLFFRNIITGKSLIEQASFKNEIQSLTANFLSIKQSKNVVLELIRLTFQSNAVTPLYRVKRTFLSDFSQFIDAQQSIITGLSQKTANTVAVNEAKKYLVETPVKISGNIKSLLYFNTSKSKQDYIIFLNIENQGHLSGNFFESYETRSAKRRVWGTSRN